MYVYIHVHIVRAPPLPPTAEPKTLGQRPAAGCLGLLEPHALLTPVQCNKNKRVEMVSVGDPSRRPSMPRKAWEAAKMLQIIVCAVWDH